MNFFEQMIQGEIAAKAYQEKQKKLRQAQEDREYELEKRRREKEDYDREKELYPLEAEAYRREHAEKMRKLDQADRERRMDSYIKPYGVTRGIDDSGKRSMRVPIPVGPAVAAAAAGIHGTGVPMEVISESTQHPVKPFDIAEIKGYKTPDDIERMLEFEKYKQEQQARLNRELKIEAIKGRNALNEEKARIYRELIGGKPESTQPAATALKKDLMDTQIKRFHDLEEAWQNELISNFIEKNQRTPSPEEYKKIVEEARQMAEQGAGINPFKLMEEIENPDSSYVAPDEDSNYGKPTVLYDEQGYVQPYKSAIQVAQNSELPEWLMPTWLKNLYTQEAPSSIRNNLELLTQKALKTAQNRSEEDKQELINIIRGGGQKNASETVKPFNDVNSLVFNNKHPKAYY